MQLHVLHVAWFLTQAQYPQHHCVGEETATRSELERLLNSADSLEWTWIVDPIDGTLNFVSGTSSLACTCLGGTAMSLEHTLREDFRAVRVN